MSTPKGPYLDLKQALSQNLVMNQQMQQAVKLLQLSNIELSEFLDDILADNPLLEKDESAPASENGDIEESFEDAVREEQTDFDAGSSMMADSGGGDTSFSPHNPNDVFENTASEEKSLRDVLVEQIQTNLDDARDRMVATLLIDELDSTGYLRDDIPTLSEKIGCKPERLEALLPQLKEFEPTGIFAKNLSECLALQLEERGALTPAFEVLLDNLNLLAEHDMKTLSKLCGTNEESVQEMALVIRTLQPRPTANYDGFVAQTAIPDVLMQKQKREAGGGWKVALNNETLPRVLVNNEYYTTVLSKTSKKEDKQYLRDQYQTANWLVRAMDQRAQTILKVAAEIVEEQNGFFLYGVEFLQPLTLKDIAEKIEMHESTVSRVTTNKYIGTPRGIFELKYFFTSSVSSTGSGGSDISSEAVKAKIEALIADETVKNVYSDDALVKELQKQGVDIARRTVAKYRDTLHIPSSTQRRRILKNRQGL